MDVWESILVLACLGTFLLEIFAFMRIIALIEEIKEGLGIHKDKVFKPGEMLAEAVISLMEKMAEDTAEGERARKAFGSCVLYAANVGLSALGQKGAVSEDGTPLPPIQMDLKSVPKEYRGIVALGQTFAPFAKNLIEKRMSDKQKQGGSGGW